MTIQTTIIEGTEFTAATMTAMRRQLRDYYGDRNYRITSDGEMHYYGNPADAYDRSEDYWHFGGNVITR